jgi:NAD(P)-dependent dehydrogenase (short-subunit alcohol dehydrogenase family)
MGRLEGRIAIVTGGASGIGRAGCELMAREGATVVVADLNEKQAATVADGIVAKGLGAWAASLDVRNSESVRVMVDEVVTRHGRIDVLFHNAVSVPLVNNHDRRITELPEDIWYKIIDLALTGTFLTAKYVAQQMLKQKSGSIILTATVDALIGQAGIDAYTAAKGGVVALTRSMAAGLSPEGVRVNALCPGFVATPHQSVFTENPAERKKIDALHLMGIMDPEDIAAFAVFLASDEARRITGGIYAADSGYTAFKAPVDLETIFQR